MRTSAPLLGLVVIAGLLSGCAGNPGAPQQGPSGPSDPGAVVRDAATGQDLFLKPNWTVGRWWQVHLATDFGFGFLQDIDGRLVVSRQTDAGFTLGSDVEGIGIFDSYFDSFYHGAFDADLNPLINGTKTELYRWPLKANDTWTTKLPAQGFRGFSGTVDEVTLNVTRFEDESGPLAPRLRVQGTTSYGERIDYDYSPRTGWMTYFRLVNASTGQVVVGLDVKEFGAGYAGRVHHVTSELLYQRFRMTPPFAPDLAPLPPTESVTVRAGYAFLEEIKFLFTFPMGAPGVPAAFGAGEIAVVVTHPDGSSSRHLHTGAGDKFHPMFNRSQVRAGTAGDWSVTIVPGGTGGAFVGLFGFKDEMVQVSA